MRALLGFTRSLRTVMQHRLIGYTAANGSTSTTLVSYWYLQLLQCTKCTPCMHVFMEMGLSSLSLPPTLSDTFGRWPLQAGAHAPGAAVGIRGAPALVLRLPRQASHCWPVRNSHHPVQAALPGCRWCAGASAVGAEASASRLTPNPNESSENSDASSRTEA